MCSRRHKKQHLTVTCKRAVTREIIHFFPNFPWKLYARADFNRICWAFLGHEFCVRLWSVLRKIQTFRQETESACPPQVCEVWWRSVLVGSCGCMEGRGGPNMDKSWSATLWSCSWDKNGSAWLQTPTKGGDLFSPCQNWMPEKSCKIRNSWVLACQKSSERLTRRRPVSSLFKMGTRNQMQIHWTNLGRFWQSRQWCSSMQIVATQDFEGLNWYITEDVFRHRCLNCLANSTQAK